MYFKKVHTSRNALQMQVTCNKDSTVARCKPPKIPCYLNTWYLFHVFMFHVINLHALPCAVAIAERSMGGMVHAYKLVRLFTQQASNDYKCIFVLAMT